MFVFHCSSISFQFSPVMSDSLWPHGLQHSRLPYPSPAPGAYSNSCPLPRWCHPTISSSVILFSSCPQSFPAPGSFPKSQLFTSGGQSIGASATASASVLPMNIQGWFPLGLTGIYKVKIFCNGVLETGRCGNIYLCGRCWQMLSSWLLATNRHPFQRLLNIYQHTTACTPSCYF